MFYTWYIIYDIPNKMKSNFMLVFLLYLVYKDNDYSVHYNVQNTCTLYCTKKLYFIMYKINLNLTLSYLLKLSFSFSCLFFSVLVLSSSLFSCYSLLIMDHLLHPDPDLNIDLHAILFAISTQIKNISNYQPC